MIECIVFIIFVVRSGALAQWVECAISPWEIMDDLGWVCLYNVIF